MSEQAAATRRYQADRMNQRQAEAMTLRRQIAITEAMLAAGANELVFDPDVQRTALVFDVLKAALEAGGYRLVES